MEYKKLSCEDFIKKSYAKEPVPGGGGVAALVGALGAALAGMVANYTAGKKKYIQFEEDIQSYLKESAALQQELLDMIDKDAQNFYPLSQAYGLPAETLEEKQYKAETLEQATKLALEVPAELVRKSYQAILIQEQLVKKGSKIVISDVGVGAVCLKAALQGAWLNVCINLAGLQDKDYKNQIEKELSSLVEKGEELCDKIYEQVLFVIQS